MAIVKTGFNHNHLDAKGEAILIDKIYGYTSGESGIRTAVIGQVINFTPKGVTLVVIQRRKQFYDNEPELALRGGDTVNVSGIRLFPVSI